MYKEKIATDYHKIKISRNKTDFPTKSTQQIEENSKVMRSKSQGETKARTASYNNSDLDTSQYFDHNYHYRSPNKVI